MKKFLILILAAAPFSALATSTSSIQLPANFTSDVLSQATDFLGNLSGYLTLVIGVILGVVVIEILIHALRK